MVARSESWLNDWNGVLLHGQSLCFMFTFISFFKFQIKFIRVKDFITGSKPGANWLSDVFLFFHASTKISLSGGMCKRWFEARFWEEILTPLCSSMIYCCLNQSYFACKAILTARSIASDRAEAKMIGKRTEVCIWEVCSFGVIPAGACKWLTQNTSTCSFIWSATLDSALQPSKWSITQRSPSLFSYQ